MTTPAAEIMATSAVPLPERLTTEEVAFATRSSVNTVRYWRHTGEGPKGYKIGRRVVYDRADVEAWIAAQKAASVGS